MIKIVTTLLKKEKTYVLHLLKICWFFYSESNNVSSKAGAYHPYAPV